MEVELRLKATEYAILYDTRIEEICFYLNEKSVVISGLDNNEKVISQFEVERSEFVKLTNLVNKL
jgi:hypothetical protein